MVSLKGLVFIGVLGLSATLGDLFLFFPAFLVVLPFSVRTFRWYADFLALHWFRLCVWMLEDYFGIKIVCSGQVPLPLEPAVLISNHRTRLDWMFLWSFVHRWGDLG